MSGTIGDNGDGLLLAGAPGQTAGNLAPTVTPALPSDDRATVESFDGVPIDVNVAFPDESEFGPGPYPLVMEFHGYGGQRFNFKEIQHYLQKGYAVYTQTNRGFHQSCGKPAAISADSDCATKGYIHLDDTRFEVRDAQSIVGELVDEGLVKPDVASQGGSYGGGMSMALAALKDRIMLPNGSYAAWTSPEGTPMSIAVSAPTIPWTDLAYALNPNGNDLDYIKDSPYYGPFGVMKQSYVSALYLGGQINGAYAPIGQDPEADITGWKALMDNGEPFDQTAAQNMLDQITKYHSSYYIDHGQAPAPLLISSGFTDDLFPAGEALRFYNRTRAEYPNSPIGLFFGSFGHPRGQNKAAVSSARQDLEDQWFDYYMKNAGSQPASNVTTYTQVCPNSDSDAGPFVTGNWVDQAPGEVTVKDTAAQTVAVDGGDRANGTLYSPNPAGLLPPPNGQACAEGTGAKETGTANYETDPAPAAGYTMMGSPTVIAKITQAGDESTLAFRLVDVSPDGATKTLVARTAYRSPGDGLQIIQLNANGWTVKQGHRLRLEILPFDGGAAKAADGTFNNYSRPSNNQQPTTIEDLELRIPVQEQPGALGGLVKAPAKRVLPDRPGATLAPGNEAIGSQTLAEYRKATYPVIGKIAVVGATVKGKVLIARVKCAAANDSCAKARVQFKGAPKRGKGRGVVLATKAGVTAAAGKTVSVRFNLTGKARKLFKDSKKRIRRHGKVRVKRVKGLKALRSRVLVGGKQARFVVVKRTGKVR
ncbi:MAG: acetylxylan esterase [Solirubrobacterales bacterium]|nr:acetylxylan esterase [Solirubrobacterales bacterium]